VYIDCFLEKKDVLFYRFNLDLQTGLRILWWICRKYPPCQEIFESSRYDFERIWISAGEIMSEHVRIELIYSGFTTRVVAMNCILPLGYDITSNCGPIEILLIHGNKIR
jgi:hypothetical protein